MAHEPANAPAATVRSAPGTAVDDLDHDWIRERLGWPLTGREEISVRSISQTGGQMGSVHQVACAGRSFILKGEPPDGSGAWGELAAVSGLLQREVELYRFLRQLPSETPRFAPECYWSASEPGGQWALALEDLGPPTAPARGMAEGLSLPQATAAVRSLALLHSIRAATGADALAAPAPWLFSASSEDLAAAIQLGLEDLPRVLADRWPEGLFGAGAARKLASVDVEAVLVCGHADAHLLSFCHGDAWAANILFDPADGSPEHRRAFLIDWQFAMWGNPLSDIALLLLSSVAPESQKEWRDRLLDWYHHTLMAHCALDYPLDHCREDFRRAEQLAALVALATTEAYTSGMGDEELSRFAPRVTALMQLAVATEQ